MVAKTSFVFDSNRLERIASRSGGRWPLGRRLQGCGRGAHVLLQLGRAPLNDLRHAVALSLASFAAAHEAVLFRSMLSRSSSSTPGGKGTPSFISRRRVIGSSLGAL